MSNLNLIVQINLIFTLSGYSPAICNNPKYSKLKCLFTRRTFNELTIPANHQRDLRPNPQASWPRNLRCYLENTHLRSQTQKTLRSISVWSFFPKRVVSTPFREFSNKTNLHRLSHTGKMELQPSSSQLIDCRLALSAPGLPTSLACLYGYPYTSAHERHGEWESRDMWTTKSLNVQKTTAVSLIRPAAYSSTQGGR